MIVGERVALSCHDCGHGALSWLPLCLGGRHQRGCGADGHTEAPVRVRDHDRGARDIVIRGLLSGDDPLPCTTPNVYVERGYSNTQNANNASLANWFAR